MSDLSSQASTINSVLHEEPAPEMATQQSLTATLLLGYGKGQSFALVRELDGEDEEFLAQLQTNKDLPYGEYITAVLERSVSSIDGEPVTKDKLNSLILADRDILFLATIKATYGPERTINVLCNLCGKGNTIDIELEKDFPVTAPDFDISKPIEVKGLRKTYQFRIPTGEDTALAAASTGTEAEVNTLVLARCAIFPTGKEPADRMAWAKKLNLADRHKIVDTLLRIELGPKLGAVDTQCSHCEKNMTIVLDWVSLLLS